MKKKAKVFIAIPTTGCIKTELAIFLLGLNRQTYDITIMFTVDGGISHNRNRLVGDFLKTDCEWLFFVDSDTIPPANALNMIENGKDICSGIYHQFQGKKLIPLVYKKYKGSYKTYINDTKDLLVEVDGVGGGCLLVHRKVFEKVKRPHFKFLYDKKGLVNLGEDFYFCRKAQREGFKVWIDKRVAASHFKTIDLKTVFLKVHKKIK